MNAKKKYIGLLFILPFFVFFLFKLYPVLYTFFLSLTEWDGVAKPEFIGFQNYTRIFTELGARFAGADWRDIPGDFWLAFVNTLRIWLPGIAIQLVLALFLSVIFTNTRLKLKGVKFFRALFCFPNIVAAVSIGILALAFLDWQHGVFNQLFHGPPSNYPRLGYPPGFNILNDPSTAPFILSVIFAWRWFGLSVIVFTVGIQGIPKTYYEAAHLDSAGKVRCF
jgi:cellobiose transport system permease protein